MLIFQKKKFLVKTIKFEKYHSLTKIKTQSIGN